MAFIVRNGRTISYRLLGGNHHPLLVMAHPLGMTQAVWDDMLVPLSGHFRILTWDLPGHGASAAWPGEDGAVSPADLVADLLAIVAESGSNQFHFVGTSIGGVVGQELIANHPERLLSATLTNTGARIGTPDGWQQRSAMVQEKGLGAMAGDIVPRWFGPRACEQQPALVNGWKVQLERTDDRSYALLSEMLGRCDYREMLGRTSVPVRLLAGGQDVATPPATLEELAEALGGAPLTVLDSIGHVPSVEDPDCFVRQLLRTQGTA